MKQARWTTCFVAFLLIMLQSSALAQYSITSSVPQSGATDADATAPVMITFDAPLDLLTLSSAPIQITGSIHGLYAFQATYDNASRTLILQPNPSFINGEHVTVSLGSELRSIIGEPLPQPTQIQFTTQNLAGMPADYLTSTERSQLDIPLLPNDSQPVKIVPADFDRDGFIDAAVVNSTSNTLTIISNRARAGVDAWLQSTRSLATGITPIDLAIADFDADSSLDIAVVNFNSNTLQLFWGRGDLSFEPTPTTVSLGARPSAVVAEDFDGDAKPDLAIAFFGEDKIQTFVNTGERAFLNGVELACEQGTFGLTSGDFDGDYDADLAAINNGAESVSIFLNTGGGWSALPALPLPGRPVAIRAGNLFTESSAAQPGLADEIAVMTGDLTLLGKASQDAARAGSAVHIIRYRSAQQSLQIESSLDTPARSVAFTLCSLDGVEEIPNHTVDLLLGDYVESNLYLHQNQDARTLNPTAAPIPAIPAPRAITCADFNRDGAVDILYASHTDNALQLILAPPRYAAQQGEIVVLDSLDFGDVLIGDSRALTSFVLPYGSFDVDVSVIVSDATHFKSEPASFEVRGGIPFPLQFVFTPSDTVRYEATAFLRTNHPLEEEPFRILMVGNGIDVDFDIEPAVLDFQTVSPQVSRTLNLTVTNKANATLVFSELRNTLPEYSFQRSNIFINPGSVLNVPVTFRADTAGIYNDTLFIDTNDLDRPLVSIPLRARSFLGQPGITSPDTVIAIEHIPFRYTATAEDPDNDPLTFRFEDIPAWTTARADSLTGTPPEGAPSETFRLFATDGFFTDSLNVFIRVLAVNNLPEFVMLENLRGREEQELRATITVRDPENEPVRLSAANLPVGATYTDNGDNTGLLVWTPQIGQAGNYTVQLSAEETLSEPANIATVDLGIIIDRLLPDLIASDLEISGQNLKAGQVAQVSAIVRNSIAPFSESWNLRVEINGVAALDSTINGMGREEQILVQTPVVLATIGENRIAVVADGGNQVPEANEDNNVVQRVLNIERGVLIVRPNPFTPNEDGRNDAVEFNLEELVVNNPAVTIFNRRGQTIRVLNVVRNNILRWDGFDDAGEAQMPGVYLYVLQDGNENVAKGYVVLAR